MSYLLITPPFVQVNTPYPATPFLKGFLASKGIESCQLDLSLETLLVIFSESGLNRLFQSSQKSEEEMSDRVYQVWAQRDEYIRRVESVIRFLQGKDRGLSYVICESSFLPQALDRDTEDEEWAFGVVGNQDKAHYLASRFVEDIVFFIQECVDPSFGFSRYAEHLGRCATSFDDLYNHLNNHSSLIDQMIGEVLAGYMKDRSFQTIVITIPFAGNLYGALRVGEWLRQYDPRLKIVAGGGFVNTELRDLSDVRFFEFFDALCFDDAEGTLLPVIDFLEGRKDRSALVRCRLLSEDKMSVEWLDAQQGRGESIQEYYTPDYSDLTISDYIPILERLNPMHKLWSDGPWLKLMLAHGCYWGKCSFCDCTLDYICRYKPFKAEQIVQSMERLIEQTGVRNFHFVDEAAPPALLKSVAELIIAKRLSVVWWGNIRFEKSFNQELCDLLRESGCIAVSGGVEVASPRILKLINKGVTLEQVVRVCDHLSASGIMVHGYLMYGFPSQTVQEVIDSLEVVRQCFELGIIQSGFWHRFALTVHSGVYQAIDEFGVRITEPPFGGFARNDVQFEDRAGVDYDPYGEGLRVSLYNYMNMRGFELPLQKWFGVKVPRTTIPPNYVKRMLMSR